MDLKLVQLSRLLPRRTSPAIFAGPAQLRAYWEGLRTGGGLPERSQLDPRGLGGILDRVFLAEPIGRGLVQVRIAGSALTEVAGMDLRGLPLSCLFAAEARTALSDALRPVIDGKALAELDLAAQGQGAGAVARLLLLPLADGPDRRLVLGCLGLGAGLLGPRLKLTILRLQVEQLPDATRTPAPAPSHRRIPHLTLVHARD